MNCSSCGDIDPKYPAYAGFDKLCGVCFVSALEALSFRFNELESSDAMKVRLEKWQRVVGA